MSSAASGGPPDGIAPPPPIGGIIPDGVPAPPGAAPGGIIGLPIMPGGIPGGIGIPGGSIDGGRALGRASDASKARFGFIACISSLLRSELKLGRPEGYRPIRRVPPAGRRWRDHVLERLLASLRPQIVQQNIGEPIDYTAPVGVTGSQYVVLEPSRRSERLCT
jgi:hypothetical protein